jgi:hypothetical protein
MRKPSLICAALVLTCCSHGAPNPTRVLTDVGITNATNAILFAVDQSTNRVVVTAQTEGEYIAVLAYHDLTRGPNRWLLWRTEFHETNRIVGVPVEIHFVQPPTRNDIGKLLKDFVPGAGPDEFTFLKM